MPKPNKKFEEIKRKVEESYRERGFRITDGDTVQSYGDESGSSLETKLVAPFIKVESSGNPPLQKMRAVYDTLEEQALYITPILDIAFSADGEINTDVSGHQKTTIGGEAYNSVKLFTLLTTMLGDGKMLIHGPPGSGKTSTSKFVGSAVYNLLTDYIERATLLGHPEQTEEKMVAMFDPVAMLKGERQLIIREWLKSPVKIIDEINRLRPESFSILYELLQSGTVTYQGQVIKATKGPIFATANASDSGNYGIPPPVKDRFDIGVVAYSLNPWQIEHLGNKRRDTIRQPLDRVILDDPLTEEDFERMHDEISGIYFPSEVMSKLAHFMAELHGCDMAGVSTESKNKGNLSDKKPPALCKDCDHYNSDTSICSTTENDIGSRTVDTIQRYSRALAYWRGHDTVSQQDLEVVLPYATWFKVKPTRKTIEMNPRFANDRIAMMQHLFELSERSYQQILNVMPDYKDMTAMVADPSKYPGRRSIHQLMNQAANLDTPAKYPLITALKKMYYSK